MKTLQEALILVPTHWPLVPGVDRWRDGDEWLSDGGWKDFSERDVKFFDYKIVIRRPIPLSVRESEAFWILHGKPFNPPYGSKIDALGGMDNIQKHYDEGPGALWRWVAEMRG